jgi:predicted amidophosphoribosyltransferase
VESPDVLNGDGSYSLSFKFDAVARLFQEETGLDTRGGRFGPWCSFKDEKQIEIARDWKARRNNLVFLRDNLDLSVALDLNFASDGEYTPLGLAEHRAKQRNDEAAVETLCSALLVQIHDLSPFRAADAICAVPPAPSKSWDLPTELVTRIAPACGKDNLSGAAKFTKEKESIKAISLEEKWKALESADLCVDSAIKGRKVILIDDKYQSGTTAQFIAAKLYEAGAQRVLGLYCVKTWRNTDNT